MDCKPKVHSSEIILELYRDPFYTRYNNFPDLNGLCYTPMSISVNQDDGLLTFFLWIYETLSSQSLVEASGRYIVVKILNLSIRVFQPDSVSVGIYTLSVWKHFVKSWLYASGFYGTILRTSIWKTDVSIVRPQFSSPDSNRMNLLALLVHQKRVSSTKLCAIVHLVHQKCILVPMVSLC